MSVMTIRMLLPLTLAATATAAEGTAFRLVATPFPWSQRVTAEGYVDRTAEAEVETGQDLRVDRAYATASLRLLGTEHDTLLLELSGGTLDLDADGPITFPDSGTRVPGSIDRVDLGLIGRHIDAADRRWVASLGIGTRSDDVTDDDDAIRYRAFGAVFLPDAGQEGPKLEGWTLGLTWSSGIDVPLPLVSYTWVHSPEFRAVIGLPFFALFWDPDPAWSISVRNVALNPGAEVGWKPAAGWKLYTRFAGEDWEGQTASRRSKNLRLSLDGWRLGLGAERSWGRGGFRKLRLEAGWEFERELVETEDWEFWDRDEETLTIDDAPYARFTAGWSF